MEDVYKTPESNLIEEDSSDDQVFYVVSGKKFWVLLIGTLGLYMTYWMYKHWQVYKDKRNYSCFPVARAIFQIFFFHDLYRQVDYQLEKTNADPGWKTNGLATLTVVALIVNYVIEQISNSTPNFGIMDVVSILYIFVLGGLYWKGQRSINAACGDILGSSNSNFTPLNILWILIGLSLWGFLVMSYASLSQY